MRDYPDDDDIDGADYEDGYGDLVWPADRRWHPAAVVIGAVIAIGAIATAVIINSGDSASTKASLGPPVSSVTSAPPSPKLTAPPSPSASASAPRTTQLPPETVTTVTTTPSAAPTWAPTAAPPTTALPPTAALNPRTVVYTVAGTKQLFDLVNIVYTDGRGFPQTEFNVSLPWSKMVVLNPGVQTVSVVATSIYSHLNCAVVNAEGQTVVASTNNGMMATCTR